jgi:hypothetical protein
VPTSCRRPASKIILTIRIELVSDDVFLVDPDHLHLPLRAADVRGGALAASPTLTFAPVAGRHAATAAAVPHWGRPASVRFNFQSSSLAYLLAFDQFHVLISSWTI